MRDEVSPPIIVKYITDDINKQQKERVRGMRYLTLSNLYNSCEPEESLKVYRQGVVKLINGLARRSIVVKLATPSLRTYWTPLLMIWVSLVRPPLPSRS